MQNKQDMTWFSRFGLKPLNPNYLLTKSLLVVATVVGLSACSAGEQEIEVWVTGNSSGYSSQINIQSLVDELSIEDVVVNRGNCSIREVPRYGITIEKELEFGESYSLTNDCIMENIVEVEVVTNSAAWHFEF